MLKTPKVVPIEEKKATLIASDVKGRRILFSIGSQRLAIDWFTRITNLPPHTGDEPSAVLPMSSAGGRKKKHV
jgi:hypothetical protein